MFILFLHIKNMELIDAILYNDERSVRKLLEDGESPNEQDENGRPALVWAVDMQNIESVRALLEYGADVDAVDQTNKTALMDAIDKRAYGIVSLLLDAGADPNIQFEGVHPVLIRAVKSNDEVNVRELLGVELDEDVNHDNRIEVNVDILTLDTGFSALMLSQTEGIAQLLVNAGATIDLEGEDGITALLAHINTDNRYNAIIEFLLLSGADPNKGNIDGITALMLASEYDLPLLISLLIRYNADPNITDAAGWSPIYTAASSNSINVIPVLVEAGGNVNLADNEYMTPVMVASRAGYYVIVGQLIDADAELLYQSNDNGKTALMYAAERGFSLCVTSLLRKDAGVNVEDDSNRTALHYAAIKGSPQCVTLLLEAGVDCLAEDMDGRTPRDLATNAAVRELLLTAENIVRANAYRELEEKFNAATGRNVPRAPRLLRRIIQQAEYAQLCEAIDIRQIRKASVQALALTYDIPLNLSTNPNLAKTKLMLCQEIQDKLNTIR